VLVFEEMDGNHMVTTDFTECSETKLLAEEDAHKTEAALLICSIPEVEETAISGGIKKLEEREEEAQLLVTSRLADNEQIQAEEDGK